MRPDKFNNVSNFELSRVLKKLLVESEFGGYIEQVFNNRMYVISHSAISNAGDGTYGVRLSFHDKQSGGDEFLDVIYTFSEQGEINVIDN